MISGRIYSWLAVGLVCSFLLADGCAPGAKGPAKTQVPKLALKFTKGDSATYRLITESVRSVQFEGSLAAENAVKGGETGDRVEMTFTEDVQSVGLKGNATVKVAIKTLKYLARVKNNPILDFDSARGRDRNSPLAKLIGHSYEIEITPSGRVAKVVDVKQARGAVGGSTLPAARASALLGTDAIKERHTITALPATGESRRRLGDNWSSVKTFSFGMMGSKAYERIYTLKETVDSGGRQVANVEMNAIPTSEAAEQMLKEQSTADFSKMFDSKDEYAGRLTLNLSTGRVEKYYEKLYLEWFIVDPMAKQQGKKQPDAVKMATTQLHSLEKVD
ncbi:MAG: hypothetical protein ACYTEQ_18835 [Planctomycetota bacterium]|jgi:hypothetical protein